MWIVVLTVMAACQIPDDTFTRTSPDGPRIDATPFLSCVGLPMTCGASGNDSCCNSLDVPGGSYYRDFDRAVDTDSGDISFPATVSNFQLDKYEVTVGRFRAFVNAGMGTQSSPPMPGAGAHANIAGSGWDATWDANLLASTTALAGAVQCDSTFQTWTAGNEHRPMNCISWYEAMAFCAWDGGYLATEAEWNYAAAGGADQRAYPWSNPAGSLTLDDSYASYYGDDAMPCSGDGSVNDLVAVGTKPAGNGRWGQADLAGNVREWTLDWYAPYATPCTDCAELVATSNRANHGGSFGSDAPNLRAGARYANIPEARDFHVGVRCARSVP